MPSDARLEILSSRGLPGWLADHDTSLAFTTYQAGKLFLLGRHPDRRLSLFERSFSRCMGLCAHHDSLWLSTLFQVWRLENALPAGHVQDGHDRLYIPRVAYTTGDLDVHDLAVTRDHQVVFVNTLFSCVATLSERASFVPLWRPPFISRLAAEDRCHLNGLALEHGAPAFATLVGRSDVADGWRDHRRSGGCVYDLRTSEPVCEGLSMPHSPRLHDGRLWLLEAGSGQLGWVDRERGRFERVAFLPGYARGLCIVGDHAVVGLSKLRRSRTFADLELGEQLSARGAEPRCGLMVIDLRSGDAVHWLRLDGVVEELYDVAALPGVQRPMALGLQSDEIQRTITIGEP
ncbi:TIGR03032 family protein [Nannocystis sp.]|uniref:TIGR03032 family protein n=1 Tax=Nannocystis sp. TaxID=1962667 RepID=UPI0025FEC76F|nr:TIGR03032 family protein [Nannocystis sp.]MBK7824901.1 TIGR03032 family protein [Nannocystis sp.]